MSQAQRNQHQKRSRRANEASQTSTFSSHLNELRTRLLLTALAFLLASGFAYTHQQELLHVIMLPLKGQELIYLTPGGGFNLIFQIAIYAGLIVCLPVLFYQLYAFIRPALPLHARRSSVKLIAAVICLITLGVLYGYFVAVPVALEFLNNFAGDAVTPSLTADSYLHFFLAYIAGLAVLSLLPLLLLFWHWIRPLSPGGLLKSERWVIAGAFIVAAIITPTPDVVNQLMIAGPVIGLYQLGVMSVLISLHLKKSRNKKAQLPLSSASKEGLS
ncbi:MAG TPA: twin-arginine translocase subunit TatC [Verrucomicrobiae bacterium]|nr:twin-arginine translocase subunit TatC [Verrucomicrobiae bacterium]